MLSRSLPFLLAAALVHGAPSSSSSPSEPRSDTYTHAQRLAPPRAFVAMSAPDADAPLDLRIHLTQRDPTGLRDALDAISDPSNPRYAQYLSRAEVEAFTQPSDETMAAVTSWLAAQGLNATRATPAGDVLSIRAPRARADSLLGARYTTFAHADSGATLVRTLQYSLPVALKGHVRTVWPGTSFFNPHSLPVSAVQPRQEARSLPLIKRLDLDALNALLKEHGLQPISVPSSAAIDALNGTTVNRGSDSGSFDASAIDAILAKLGLPSLESGNVKVIVHDGPGAVFNGSIADLPAWLREHGIQGAKTIVLPPVTTTIGVPAPAPTKTKTTKTITTTVTIHRQPTVAPSEPTPAPQDPTNAPVPSQSNPASVPVPKPTPGSTDASCRNTITPRCLQQLYQIPSTPARVQSNKLGVTAYIGQFGQNADLQTFLKEFRPDLSSATGFETQSIDGGANPQGVKNAGVEANLDLQYTIGVASGVPTTFITVGNNKGGGNGFLDTITTLIGADAPPQVLTTSYGQNEDDVSPDLADTLCNAYMQLGARGVSIIFASGDSGAGACDGGRDFQPTFPSGCPYITTVGSTDGVAPERGATFSSGGFSNLFKQPSYQSSAVASYLARFPNATISNPGRAFPDVSALGTHYAIISGGKQIGVQGTSASAPVFAAMIALLNDERAQHGIAPLGFLNPWLYGAARGAFVDVVQGSNPGCGKVGYQAAPGWDPVTGLGSPNYPALRAAAGLA